VRVIDALVQHFSSFQHEERQLPVLWHQSLLVFAQRYKTEFTPEQITSLLAILAFHKHPLISKEIRRELSSAKGTNARTSVAVVALTNISFRCVCGAQCWHRPAVQIR